VSHPAPGRQIAHLDLGVSPALPPLVTAAAARVAQSVSTGLRYPPCHDSLWPRRARYPGV